MSVCVLKPCVRKTNCTYIQTGKKGKVTGDTGQICPTGSMTLNTNMDNKVCWEAGHGSGQQSSRRCGRMSPHHHGDQKIRGLSTQKRRNPNKANNLIEA